MRAAERQQPLHVRACARGNQGSEPAGRIARDAQPGGVDLRCQCGLGLHGSQRGRQVIHPVPHQDAAGLGHRVRPVVAGMIHRDHHVPGPRHRGAEPAHHPGTATVAVREQHDRPAAFGNGGIGGGRTDLEQGRPRRADRQRGFLRIGLGRIPHGVAHAVAVVGIAHGRTGRMRNAVPLADGRHGPSGKQGQAQRQQRGTTTGGHSHGSISLRCNVSASGSQISTPPWPLRSSKRAS